MSKENKIFFGIFLVCSLLLILYLGVSNASKKQNIIDNIVDEVLASEDTAMLYIGSSKCEACAKQASQMALLMEDYEFDYYYIDMEEITTSKKQSQVVEKLKIDVTNGLITPSILIYKNGKIIDQLSNLNCANKIFNLLTKNQIIITDKELPINYLNYSSFNSMVDSNKKEALILGAVSYDDSNTADEIFWNIAKTYSLKLNYLMLDDLSQEEFDSFQNKINHYIVNTPSIIIIENGEVINEIANLQEEIDYIDFLQENGIIK